MNFENPPIHNEEEKPVTSRRNFLKTSVGAFAAGFAGSLLVETSQKESEPEEEPLLVIVKKPRLKEDEFLENEEGLEEDTQKREIVAWSEFKKLKPNVSYEEHIPPLRIENLRMPDDVGKYGAETFEGKILRTLRYQNVTNAVEERYNLPPGILMSMIIEESTGVDLLPNARGDGGFGLCHMQGSTAVEYGLKTFCGCDSLVCDGKDARSCKGSKGVLEDHAGELASFMHKHARDRKTLVKADERLHILLNIDAAGRMLAAGIAGPALKGELADLGPFRRSIARYAGAYNYEKYWEDICRNMRALRDQELVNRIGQVFNRKNPDLKINGKKSTFAGYIKAMQQQNKNYGLEEYKKLPKYEPKNSVAVLRTFENYI